MPGRGWVTLHVRRRMVESDVPTGWSPEPRPRARSRNRPDALEAPAGEPEAAVGSLLGDAGRRKLSAGEADVGASRERIRRSRLTRLALVLVRPARLPLVPPARGQRVRHPGPVRPEHRPAAADAGAVLPGADPAASSAPRSVPAARRTSCTGPSRSTSRLDDVIGIDAVKEDVVRSLNLFLAHKTFADEMGGTPRRGLLFEGAPGTGKTLPGQGDGPRGRGAVPVRVGDVVPVDVLRRHGPQDPLVLQGAAQGRPPRGRRDRLHRGDRRDRHGPRRAVRDGRCRRQPRVRRDVLRRPRPACPRSYAQPRRSAASRPCVNRSIISEGVGGVVNELLVQMQSFDEPTGWQKLHAWFVDQRQPAACRPTGSCAGPSPPPTNVLVIAATNRADNLDPALLRPGRFDRRLTFEPPDEGGSPRARRPLPGDARRTTPSSTTTSTRDALAAVTQGYTPVMIEHLFDEALVNARAPRRARDEPGRRRAGPARRGGRPRASRSRTPTHEKRLIATHEAGHATAAWLVAPQRRLEVLTIIKRRDALGMLAHGDAEDVYTRSAAEMLRADPDRDGRPVRRGAVLRRRLHRARRRPALRHQRRRPDGRGGRHDRHPGLVPGGPGQRRCRTPTSSAGCSATAPGRERVESAPAGAEAASPAAC